jgi:hypothetical protein
MKKYFEDIENKFIPGETYGSFIRYDIEYGDKKLYYIKCLSFERLYANIIIYLYDNDVIKLNEDDINKLKHFSIYPTNCECHADTVLQRRIYINSFYIKMSVINRNLVLFFVQNLSNDIMMHNLGNIIYYDVDEIYYFGDLVIPIKLELKYEIENIDFFYIQRRKSYIRIKNNIIRNKIRGVNSKVDDIISEAKTKIRDDKIKQILT